MPPLHFPDLTLQSVETQLHASCQFKNFHDLPLKDKVAHLLIKFVHLLDYLVPTSEFWMVDASHKHLSWTGLDLLDEVW